MKRGGGKAKGSSFERKIAKMISEWWSDGERDDIYGRSTTSGAWAKTRAKTAQSTFGQYGDLQALDPFGQPLIDACTFEFKIGYNQMSLLACIDKPENAAVQTLERFLAQVTEDHQNAGSVWPVLIFKRDRRDPTICIPRTMYEAIVQETPKTPGLFDHIAFSRRVGDYEHEQWVIFRLDAFLEWCSPNFFSEGKWEMYRASSAHEQDAPRSDRRKKLAAKLGRYRRDRRVPKGES